MKLTLAAAWLSAVSLHAAVAPIYHLEDRTISGYGEIARIEHDETHGTTRISAPNGGATQFPWGTERYSEAITHETQDAHPELTTVRGEYGLKVTLPDRTLDWQSDVEWRSDRDNFYYVCTRRLLKDGQLVREKLWRDTIPRDHQ